MIRTIRKSFGFVALSLFVSGFALADIGEVLDVRVDPGVKYDSPAREVKDVVDADLRAAGVTDSYDNLNDLILLNWAAHVKKIEKIEKINMRKIGGVIAKSETHQNIIAPYDFLAFQVDGLKLPEFNSADLTLTGTEINIADLDIHVSGTFTLIALGSDFDPAGFGGILGAFNGGASMTVTSEMTITETFPIELQAEPAAIAPVQPTVAPTGFRRTESDAYSDHSTHESSRDSSRKNRSKRNRR